jgi:hypothetical protein
MFIFLVIRIYSQEFIKWTKAWFFATKYHLLNTNLEIKWPSLWVSGLVIRNTRYAYNSRSQEKCHEST